MMHLLDSPIQDGGQWDMWVNLINKYGVVPKSEMPETYQSGKSMRMNRMITRKLREFAKELRDSINNKASEEELYALKNRMLATVYKMLVIHLGNPPESFDWQTRDKKREFHRFKNLTPLSFFNEHVEIDLNELVCLIDCPMSDKEYNKVEIIPGDEYELVRLGDIYDVLYGDKNELHETNIKEYLFDTICLILTTYVLT